MIEADVNLGYVIGSDGAAKPQPVMAHPPQIFSDLSLVDFMEIVVNVSGLGFLTLMPKLLKLLLNILLILKECKTISHFRQPLTEDSGRE